MPEEEREERRQREDDGERILQRRARDPHQRGEQQGEADRPESPEDAEDLRPLAEVDVDPRQRRERDETGEDEEEARQRAGGMAALLVPDVDGELQRFRAGQDMAEVQRADELLLLDPLLPLDDLQVHQADLTDRPAEG